MSKFHMEKKVVRNSDLYSEKNDRKYWRCKIMKKFIWFNWNIKILFFLNYPIFNVQIIQSLLIIRNVDNPEMNVNLHKIS